MRLLCFLLTATFLAANSSYGQTFQTQNKVKQSQSQAALPTFQIAERDQRVRFFLSDQEAFDQLIDGSPANNILLQDHERERDVPYSPTAAICSPASRCGIADFADNSQVYGLVVNPHLIICQSNLLQLIKVVGDLNPSFFVDSKIGELNLFLLPIAGAVNDSYYKMEIRPAADGAEESALNIQIPISAEDGSCHLPSAESLRTAFAAIK